MLNLIVSTNLNKTNLGCKVSTGESEIVIAEVKAFKEFKKKCESIRPINSAEHAELYRKFLVEFDRDLAVIHKTKPKLELVMKEMNLVF